ncbi:hypothetical protein AB0K09_00430 [Streptomyces sp. NPDC049577]|uniref:hypothetical protein n=1 Tax=Streptomyces sp. NPDC049577 TaxID=3155153 RepID=UPI00343D136B
MDGLQPGYWFGGLRIQLGPITFGVVDSAYVHWHCDTFEGWDAAEVRAEVTQREADHGAWAAPVYLGERPITLGGKATAPTRSAADDAIERLLAAVSLTDTTLTVYESIPKQATVRRSGKPLIRRLTDKTIEWSALVTAADPRRYATALQTGTTGLPSTSGGLTEPYTLPYTITAATVTGSITATNTGTFETRPVYLIDGPVSQPQVLTQMPDGTVRALTYGLDLATGDRLIIDTDAHTATLADGVSRRRFLSAPSGWPVIPAGASVAIQFQAATYDPTALLTARWRSAWI